MPAGWKWTLVVVTLCWVCLPACANAVCAARSAALADVGSAAAGTLLGIPGMPNGQRRAVVSVSHSFYPLPGDPPRRVPTWQEFVRISPVGAWFILLFCIGMGGWVVLVGVRFVAEIIQSRRFRDWE